MQYGLHDGLQKLSVHRGWTTTHATLLASLSRTINFEANREEPSRSKVAYEYMSSTRRVPSSVQYLYLRCLGSTSELGL